MRALTLIAPFVLLACSNGPAGGTDAAGADAAGTDAINDAADSGGGTRDARVADAGAVDSSWGFAGGVTADCDGNAALATCAVEYIVGVVDSSNNGIDDAVVTINGQTLPAGMGGVYRAPATAPFASNYDVSVTHAGVTYRTTLQSPDDYMLTLAPDPPALNTEATVTWTPSGQAGVRVVGQVIQPGGLPSYNTSQDDTGTMTLPAEAFPQSGYYRILVQRRIDAPDDPSIPTTGGSARDVILVRTLNAMVP